MNTLQNTIINLKPNEQLVLMNYKVHNSYFDTTISIKVTIECNFNEGFVITTVVTMNNEVYVRTKQVGMCYFIDTFEYLFVDLLYDLESIGHEIIILEQIGFTNSIEYIELTDTDKKLLVSKYDYNKAFDELNEIQSYNIVKYFIELYKYIKNITDKLNITRIVSEDYDLTSL